ncbi:hypothetical protein BB561_001502 [Smittium simulii]|uniref:sphinganine-1-phosphate aldolase n=1 Tax=Smittium simulii TaxID=133385 RepID=A0A2T9YUB9_9FUNG|nr:hypothetical protein BB561_001502 [Smittium simulii]
MVLHSSIASALEKCSDITKTAPTLFLQSDKIRLFGYACLFYYGINSVAQLSRELMIYGLVPTIRAYTKILFQKFFQALQGVSFVKNVVDNKVGKIVDKLQKDMINEDAKNGIPDYISLPAEGMTDDAVLEILESRMKEGKIDWKNGRVSGAIYHGGDDMVNLTNKAISLYNVTNPLHPGVFPGLRRLEAEIVAMTLEMFHGDNEQCGVTTSGGTESIIMSIRAHLQFAKSTKNITKPNIIVPVTIHTAFDKACDYFGIEIIHIPIDEKTGKVVLSAVKNAINYNTIMLAGSAVNYPHGVMDDIKSLSEIAQKYNIGMHVDCCLGSFVIAFMEQAGYDVDVFDFRLPGVTAISCDTHKYGFAPKGTSVLMFANKELRRYMYFIATKWPGGIYASPSMPGSRPGSLIAGCWAAMTSMGKQGYISSCKNIIESRMKIQKGIESIKELFIIGNPICSVVAFGSIKSVNIYSIKDSMEKKGWDLSTLHYPPALHIACTMLTIGNEEQLLEDLQASVNEVIADPMKYSAGSAAMYGAAVSLPDDAPIETIAAGFIDSLYAT